MRLLAFRLDVRLPVFFFNGFVGFGHIGSVSSRNDGAEMERYEGTVVAYEMTRLCNIQAQGSKYMVYMSLRTIMKFSGLLKCILGADRAEEQKPMFAGIRVRRSLVMFAI